MTLKEITRFMRYGAYASDKKKGYFVRDDIAKQVQAGHAVIFTLPEVHNLPNLWLLSVSIILQ